jgi:hypothetical protein
VSGKRYGMKEPLKDYVTIALLGALTGCAFVGISAMLEANALDQFGRQPTWLAVPLSAPFGILVAMIVRSKITAQNGGRGVGLLALLIASTAVALVLAAGSVDFLLSDDSTPQYTDYAMSGAIGGLIGAAFMAIVIWVLLRRRNIRFSGWPMVIAGTFGGAFWPEGVFQMRYSLTMSCLFFPLWQACVASGLWFGLRNAASNQLRSKVGD